MVEKLNSGQPITISAIGGSITHGHGAGSASQPLHGDPNLLHGHPGSWSRIVFDYVQGAWPNAKHTYSNGAVPATGSDFFSLCVERQVPQSADIVFMEFSVNDAGGMNSQVLQQQEMIVRRLRSILPNASLVFVNFWTHFPVDNAWEPEWFASPEVQTTALAQYYVLYKYRGISFNYRAQL